MKKQAIGKKSSRGARAGYSTVSAKLEEAVLRGIREKTTSVRGCLNDAAERELHFDRLRTFDEALERERVGIDQRFYRNLKAWSKDWDARVATKARARARAKKAR